ncbi:MAG TPA: hypothetical protein VNG51_27725 [Ktedonobacteraceae bacterium]|nr:hypothetical protein [Ktedonobacteraceae bacterium]
MSVTPHCITLREWEYCTPESSDSTLAGVFLKDDPETKRIVQALSESRTLEIAELRNGLSIRASSFIGRITLGDLQITVQPKITGAPFIRLLRYAYDLRDLDLSTVTSYVTEQSAFQELLIAQLIEEVQELISRGLQRRYVRRDEEMVSPRGTLQVHRIVRQGGVVSATLPCTYYPRIEDCLINQVLLQGLLLAARLTNDSTLLHQLYHLARPLQENVNAIRLDNHVLKKLYREMDRLTAAYRSAIKLIELLQAGEGIALNEDTATMLLPGFLFDMNLFFQTLLSRFLREHVQGYTVQDQYNIRGMMSYDPAHNPQNRQAPTLRPDYVVHRGANVVAILDAKYRDLWESRLPEHMLYQLAMYALSQPGGVEATILYPTISSDAEDARIIIRDPIYEESRASVVLRPVNLLELDELLNSSRTIGNQRKRSVFAEWLAFGRVNASH